MNVFKIKINDDESFISLNIVNIDLSNVKQLEIRKLSEIESLPREIYERIGRYSSKEDWNSLTKTSKTLYSHKDTRKKTRFDDENEIHLTIEKGQEIILTANEIEVNWGDGTINRKNRHTYNTSGKKVIYLIGKINSFSSLSRYLTKVHIRKQLYLFQYPFLFDNCVKLEKVECSTVWVLPPNCDHMFHCCEKLVSIPKIDFSKVRSATGMFYNCSSFNQDINYWDTSHLMFADTMFCDCKNFNKDLDKWNIENLGYARSMFTRCINFNGNVSTWKTIYLRDASYMFQGCIKFNCDLSKWTLFNVIDLKSMFEHCDLFDCDLNEVPVDNCENMSFMFSECYNFNSNLANWNINNVTNLFGIFSNCHKFEGKGLETWKSTNVRAMPYAFYKCVEFKSNLSSWDISKCKNFLGAFEGCGKLNFDISRFSIM